jgi:sulfate adenylyltransferase subunit 1
MSETIDSKGYLNMELLRFTTAGSVDDGKSTLIGRLLFDSKAIFQDQLDQLEFSSKLKGKEDIDLALLTDGLKAEREQGITIDVAYRYFATPKRKFIIADTPGHIEYTRNMVTGASTANLALILVDARHGIVEQTRRHCYIASLLQIPHVVVCVNKMDLVDYSQEAFDKIKDNFKEISAKLDLPDVRFVPISALKGDNVVNKSQCMDWYEGTTLMYILENIHISSDNNLIDARFPVQYVIRPQDEENHDYRGYAGRVSGGIFRKGDEVKVLPSGFTSKIKSIDTFEGEIEETFAPQSVTITLEDDIDISRGDMIVKDGNHPEVEQEFDVMMCWLNNQDLVPSGKYTLKHTSKEAMCMIKQVHYKVDMNTLQRNEESKDIKMNDVFKVRVRTNSPVFFDSYRKNRVTGSLVLIDQGSNATVAAGMIV